MWTNRTETKFLQPNLVMKTGCSPYIKFRFCSYLNVWQGYAKTIMQKPFSCVRQQIYVFKISCTLDSFRFKVYYESRHLMAE